jgi:hypothetical protein
MKKMDNNNILEKLLLILYFTKNVKYVVIRDFQLIISANYYIYKSNKCI